MEQELASWTTIDVGAGTLQRLTREGVLACKEQWSASTDPGRSGWSNAQVRVARVEAGGDVKALDTRSVARQVPVGLGWLHGVAFVREEMRKDREPTGVHGVWGVKSLQVAAGVEQGWWLQLAADGSQSPDGRMMLLPLDGSEYLEAVLETVGRAVFSNSSGVTD